MKNLKSKLFESLKIESTELSKITGGNLYTSRGSDTSQGSSYDVVFQTLDENGQNGVWDTQNTGAGTKDKPALSQY